MKGREDHVVVATAKVPCKETGLPLVSLTTVGTGYDEHPSRRPFPLLGFQFSALPSGCSD